jgi:quinol-cytochrome oxidoreductase complex cytochrome b subunit
VIVVLRRGSSPDQIAEVVSTLEARGVQVHELVAGGQPVLHVTGGSSRRARSALRFDCVEGLVATSGPRVRREGQRFFPYYFVQWTAIGFVLLAGLTLLAGQFPPGVGAPVDLRDEPVAIAPPWYLRAPLAFVAWFPTSLRWLGWLLVAGSITLVVLLPVLDKSEGERWRWRGFVLAITVVLVAAVLVPIACGVLP